MPVKIYSDPTGTGIFTVQNPNSSTSRTITLPDAAGTLYATGSILGTVAQVAGIPTSAIFETGSNANGDYTKFANGLMICYKIITLTPVANTPTLSVWTLPQTYASAPMAFASARTTVPGTTVLGVGAINETTTTVDVYVTRTNTNATSVNVFAIGKWF